MSKTRTKLLALHEQMRVELPGFQIREKRVWFWWLLNYVGLIFLWNPRFMTTMWTTVGRTVWVPNAHELFDAQRDVREMEADYCTLWHERRHMLDLRDFVKLPAALRGLIWGFGYGCPQWLALGALGAFWSPWWLLCLLFLAPWPSPFRVWVERRGYLASCEAWLSFYPEWDVTVHDPWMQRVITENFLGWRYYRMAWSRKRIEDWFAPRIEDLRRGARLDYNRR